MTRGASESDMAPKKAVLRALTIGQPNAGETMSDRIRRVRSEMQHSGDRASVTASAPTPFNPDAPATAARSNRRPGTSHA